MMLFKFLLAGQASAGLFSQTIDLNVYPLVHGGDPLEKVVVHVKPSISISKLKEKIGEEVGGRVETLTLGGDELVNQEKTAAYYDMETGAELRAFIDKEDYEAHKATKRYLGEIKYLGCEKKRTYTNFNKYHIAKKSTKAVLPAVGGTVGGAAVGAAGGVGLGLYAAANTGELSGTLFGLTVAGCAVIGAGAGGWQAAKYVADADVSQSYFYKFKHGEQEIEVRYSDMRAVGDLNERALPDFVDGFDRKHFFSRMKTEKKIRDAWFSKHFQGEFPEPIRSKDHTAKHDRQAKEQIQSMFEYFFAHSDDYQGPVEPKEQ